ncbi:MAG TPA: hypothetical protein DHV86_04490, partial [Methylophilaceae bacterium]|nr:hypothetical protein [Methylophilaceae bacterium]
MTEPLQALDPSNQATKLWKSSNKKKLIAVGRFKAQKNFINLVDAIDFAKKNLGLDVSLLILGDGEERHKISSRIIELGLEENVFLAGWVSDPLPYYDLSDLFILSSDYEGFG